MTTMAKLGCKQNPDGIARKYDRDFWTEKWRRNHRYNTGFLIYKFYIVDGRSLVKNIDSELKGMLWIDSLQRPGQAFPK